MKKSRCSEAQILGILRQQDQTVAQICREHRISEPTFYSWKSKFGRVSVSEFQRLKHLEDENRCLKQLYTELSLEKSGDKGGLAKKVATPTARRAVAQQWTRWRDAHVFEALAL